MSGEAQRRDEIADLLRLARQAGGAVEEFCRLHLATFREECESALRWHRTEGRSLVVAGEDPDRVRARVESAIAAGRRRLLEKLVRLLEWARKGGRI